MTDPRAARRTLLSAALISLVLGAGSVSAQEAAPEPEAAAPAEKQP